jgi:hypothetical protein
MLRIRRPATSPAAVGSRANFLNNHGYVSGFFLTLENFVVPRLSPQTARSIRRVSDSIQPSQRLDHERRFDDQKNQQERGGDKPDPTRDARASRGV